VNPKDKIGAKKVSTWVIPTAAIYHLATALMDGARKYGAYNWRDEPVQCSIYLDAMQRHKDLYAAGQDKAADSKVKHLAHVMGCCAILIDAELHGKLIDDRRKSPEFVELIDTLNDFVKHQAEPPKPQPSDDGLQNAKGTPGGLSYVPMVPYYK
jgi:hypothetical protein